MFLEVCGMRIWMDLWGYGCECYGLRHMVLSHTSWLDVIVINGVEGGTQ
jgi:hypothetical protein